MRVTVARVSEMIVGDVVTRMWPRRSRKDSLAQFKVVVEANRSASGSSEVVVPPEYVCAEAAPGAQEPARDCGARKLRGRLNLLPAFARTGRGLGIEISGPYMAGGFEDLVGKVYEHCELVGPSGLQKTGMVVVSARKLFGTNPRLIASGERRSVSDTGTGRSETTIGWRMTLVRRGKTR